MTTADSIQVTVNLVYKIDYTLQIYFQITKHLKQKN